MKKKTLKEEKILKECRKLVKKNPKLKRKKLSRIKDLEKRLYYTKVWFITESQPLHKLKNSKKRGWRKYHLDHIVPIIYGFLNNIPCEKIGSLSNIKFIPYKQNIKKGFKLTEASHRVLRRIKRTKK